MVRFSVTMDDSLTGTIDTSCAKKEISRSDWISEACTAHLARSNGTGVIGATSLPSAGPVLGPDHHNMPDYEEMERNFRIDVPEYFNFGLDVIDAWANKDRNKLAMIWVNQEGEEKKFTFWDLMRLSNQIVNIMIKYGVNKGDKVLIMLPRVPEWWTFTI
ncbi:MAG: AMP-binding protein, partial [Methanoregula sp.]